MPNDYFGETKQVNLAFWGFGQMMKGAAWGAGFLLSIGLVLWVLYGIGLLLPEESRQTPSPYGAMDVVATEMVA